MYPPARYFRQAWAAAPPKDQAPLAGNTPAPGAASTNDTAEAKIESVLHEPDFA